MNRRSTDSKFRSRKFIVTMIPTVTGCVGFLISAIKTGNVDLASFGIFAAAMAGMYGWVDNNDPHKNKAVPNDTD